MEEKQNYNTMEEDYKKAVLCSIYHQGKESEAKASLDELERLLETAGGKAEAIVMQMRDAPDVKTVLGKGKIEELRELCQNAEIDIVIFDMDLTPSQIREIEKAIGDDIRVIDRSMLILDIFALHAKSSEGRLQVELAQLKYTAPRLTGHGKELSRLGGSASGSIGSRGPGETKLEIDRRRIRSRISFLENSIDQISSSRAVMRKARERSGIKRCGIVGYTNSGKSTLLNKLTSADILAEDKLFATLDTTTRKYTLPGGTQILLTDTVGFINKLPHHLIKAFKSTLDEAAYSDILLIVIDISNPECALQLKVTLDTLEELGAGDKPTIYVLNKCDAVYDGGAVMDIRALINGSQHVCISARTGEGIDELILKLEAVVNSEKKRVKLMLSQTDGALLNLIYSDGDNVIADYEEDKTIVEATVDEKLYGKVKNFIIAENI